MDARAIAELFADRVEVRHEGRTFAFRAPSLPEASAVLQRFGKATESLPEGADAKVPYLAALSEAVELTLIVDDGDLPEGIGQRIVLATGGIVSPIGQAAARLVGLPLVGGAEVPDDLPT